MMAAIAAAGRGAQVTLIEPNERLGKKLNITGKGRCNVTNNCTEEALLQNIPRNGKFLYSSFSAFNSQDAMAFFEELGVPLKTERGNRVFPQSDCSFDVSGALKHRLDRLKVHWSHDRAVSIETEEGAVTGVRGEKDTYPAEAVVLATGGVSYPATGSTGDGYRMAADGSVVKTANHSGGVLGGISDGSDLVFRAAFKPTPSISRSQETVSRAGENIELSIKGRHDPVVVPRAVVVVEAMAALTVMDMLLVSMSSRLDMIQLFFQVENVEGTDIEEN